MGIEPGNLPYTTKQQTGRAQQTDEVAVIFGSSLRINDTHNIY